MPRSFVRGVNPDSYACCTDDLTDDEITRMKHIDWANTKGSTRLHVAVRANMPCMVKRLLLQNADCRLKDRHEKTAVRIAVEFGYIEIVKLFCKAGVDMNGPEHESSKPNKNQPLFLCAVDNCHLEVVEVLIKYGMDPSVRNLDGTSGVHLAASHDFDLDMLTLLIEIGVDVNLQAQDKATALGMACRYDNLPGMQLLLSAGADVHVKDKDGNTPLHLALYGSYKEHLQTLLEHGADMYTRNEDGVSVLDSASYLDVVCMYTLIQYGADLETRDGERKTAFLHAVKCRNYKVIRLLMNVGADLSVRDMDHNTAIHFAANDGDAGLIKELLDAGISVPQANFYHKTPLDLAIAAEGPLLGRFEKRAWWVDHEECQVVLRQAMARNSEVGRQVKDVTFVE
jgi:ankyrin repeat protein